MVGKEPYEADAGGIGFLFPFRYLSRYMNMKMKNRTSPPETGQQGKESQFLFSGIIRLFSILLYPVFFTLNIVISKTRDVLDLEPEKEDMLHASPGDVICVHRIGFEHFGIYAGDDRVIHYDIDPSENFKILIHEASIEEFLNGMDIYYTCCFPPVYGIPTENMEFSGFKKLMEHPERSGKLWDYLKIVEYRLYTPKETLARARSRIGESNYNLFSNNCEHFALWCKTGISESHQISGLLDTLMMTDYKGHVIKMSSDMANEKIQELT